MSINNSLLISSEFKAQISQSIEKLKIHNTILSGIAALLPDACAPLPSVSGMLNELAYEFEGITRRLNNFAPSLPEPIQAIIKEVHDIECSISNVASLAESSKEKCTASILSVFQRLCRDLEKSVKELEQEIEKLGTTPENQIAA